MPSSSCCLSRIFGRGEVLSWLHVLMMVLCTWGLYMCLYLWWFCVLEACTCACTYDGIVYLRFVHVLVPVCDGIVFWFVCSSNLQDDDEDIFLDPTDVEGLAKLEEKRRQDKKEDYRPEREGEGEGKVEGGEKKERKRKRRKRNPQSEEDDEEYLSARADFYLDRLWAKRSKEGRIPDAWEGELEKRSLCGAAMFLPHVNVIQRTIDDGYVQIFFEKSFKYICLIAIRSLCLDCTCGARVPASLYLYFWNLYLRSVPLRLLYMCLYMRSLFLYLRCTWDLFLRCTWDVLETSVSLLEMYLWDLLFEMYLRLAFWYLLELYLRFQNASAWNTCLENMQPDLFQ